MKSEETITRTLERQGWRRQFIAAEPRLSEAAENTELGFQVHLEPLPTQEKSRNAGKKCRACFEGTEEQYSIIFTKPAEYDGQPCSD